MKKMNSISRPLLALALALALPGASCLVEYIVTKKGITPVKTFKCSPDKGFNTHTKNNQCW